MTIRKAVTAVAIRNIVPCIENPLPLALGWHGKDCRKKIACENGGVPAWVSNKPQVVFLES
jgi:hypothetical protein